MVLANRLGWPDGAGRLLPIFMAGAVTTWFLFFVMQSLVSVTGDVPAHRRSEDQLHPVDSGQTRR
jgi:hypothetical protein